MLPVMTTSVCLFTELCSLGCHPILTSLTYTWTLAAVRYPIPRCVPKSGLSSINACRSLCCLEILQSVVTLLCVQICRLLNLSHRKSFKVSFENAMCVDVCGALFCPHVIVLFVLRNQIINYFNFTANLTTVAWKIVNIICCLLSHFQYILHVGFRPGILFFIQVINCNFCWPNNLKFINFFYFILFFACYFLRIDWWKTYSTVYISLKEQ